MNIGRLAGLVICAAVATTSAHAQAQTKGKKSAPPGEVTLVCEAVYMPNRTTWTRTVTVVYDKKRVNTVKIDGVAVYTFSVQGTAILTAIDNERIQIDTAAHTWSSDFRGQATSEGRCERR